MQRASAPTDWSEAIGPLPSLLCTFLYFQEGGEKLTVSWFDRPVLTPTCRGEGLTKNGPDAIGALILSSDRRSTPTRRGTKSDLSKDGGNLLYTLWTDQYGTGRLSQHCFSHLIVPDSSNSDELFEHRDKRRSSVN